MVQRASGEFEICKERTLLVSGRVRVPTNIREEYVRNFPTPNGIGNLSLTGEEVYGNFEQRGYQYRGLFRGILEAKLMKQGENHVSCENKIPSSTLSLRLFNQDTLNSHFNNEFSAMVISIMIFRSSSMYTKVWYFIKKWNLFPNRQNAAVCFTNRFCLQWGLIHVRINYLPCV